MKNINIKNNKIKRIRMQLGYSQQDFAIKLGITNEHLSRIENGAVKLSDRTKMKLVNTFGVNLDYLEDTSEVPFLTENVNKEIFENEEKNKLDNLRVQVKTLSLESQALYNLMEKTLNEFEIDKKKNLNSSPPMYNKLDDIDRTAVDSFVMMLINRKNKKTIKKEDEQI